MDLLVYCVKEHRKLQRRWPRFWPRTLNEKESWVPFWNIKIEDKYAGMCDPVRQASGTTFNPLRTWAEVLYIAQKHQSIFKMA